MKSYKLPTAILLISALSALSLFGQENPLSGRIQYTQEPGQGAGSMKFLDQKLPQPTIRVGPAGEAGTGLAFLIGIEVTPEGRNKLMMARKIELLINVAGVDQFNGAPPSALKVGFLKSGAPKNVDAYPHFGAWNSAEDFAVVGSIAADSAPGQYKFDVTNLLETAPTTTSTQPMLFFAIYSPVSDLVAANAGRHVLIVGEGEDENGRPNLLISE